MSLSLKNGWLDEEKRVFIIFKIEEIQEILGFSKKKSIEYLSELEELGLVEKKRRGLGLPSILYIKSFMLPDVAENDEMGTSRGVENALQEVSILEPLEVSFGAPQNNTKENNININNTKSNQISSLDTVTEIVMGECGEGLDEMDVNDYARYIRERLEIDLLINNRPLDGDIIEGIYDLVLETLISQRESMIIDSNRYPMSMVRRKFIRLTVISDVPGTGNSKRLLVKDISKVISYIY